MTSQLGCSLCPHHRPPRARGTPSLGSGRRARAVTCAGLARVWGLLRGGGGVTAASSSLLAHTLTDICTPVCTHPAQRHFHPYLRDHRLGPDGKKGRRGDLPGNQPGVAMASWRPPPGQSGWSAGWHLSAGGRGVCGKHHTHARMHRRMRLNVDRGPDEDSAPHEYSSG